MPNTNLYNLKQVDYSERGQTVEIIVDGVPKAQTVIFSSTDCFGDTYYFTEQGLRYITDSRNKRPVQRFVLNHQLFIKVKDRQNIYGERYGKTHHQFQL